MEFGILGPLLVRREGTEVAIAGTKRRALLARLLVDAGRTVSVGRLVDDLWGDDATDATAQTLQSHVHHLRRRLGTECIETDPGGYRLKVGAGELDADAFAAELAEARAALAADRPTSAEEAATRALARWRGDALADVADLEWARPTANRLDEQRHEARETLIDALLASGDTSRAIALADECIDAAPLREQLWAKLMLGLYRAGRQADALAAYQRLRGALSEELGLAPSEELRNLEQAILDQDADLRGPRHTAPAALPSGVVTFLLTDVAGSTRLWEEVRLPMAEALLRHDEIIRTVVEDHAGVLLKARGEGDSTFSVFQRATDAAAAALDAQRALGAEPWPDRCAIRVRMALHTGEALERDGDYYGRTVNRVARLRAVADPGQILVTRATSDLVVDHLTENARLVELGTQELRDLDRPETVYLLAERAAGPPADEATRAATRALRAVTVPMPAGLRLHGDAGLIGRESELARLHDTWSAVALGAPASLALLNGEAGVGKTRLAAALAERAAHDGALVLYGRCDEDPSRPYQPVAEALSGMFQGMPDDAVSAIAGDVAPDLAPMLPELQRRVAMHAPATTERFVLFQAAATVLARVAADRPVLVVLDDLHWADAPSLVLVRHLLRTRPDAALMVVGTYRDGDVDPSGPLVRWLVDARREAPTVELRLQGLDRAAVSVLLGPERRHHLDEVWSVTDGNPFFVIELRANLLDAASRGVPQSIRQSVADRARRLPPATWKFVHAAAIAGSDIDVAIAGAAAQVAVDDAIPAVTTGLLVEVPDDAGALRFAHALVRDAVLDGLTSIARADLHRRVASAIQELHAERLDEYAGRLAHHYREAGNARADGPAYEWSMRAGRRAGQLLAYEEAEQHFGAAADIARTSGDAARRISAELELAEVLRRGGRPSAGQALAESAARAAHAIGETELAAWAMFITRFGQPVGMPGNLEAVQETRAALAADSVWRAPLDIVFAGELMQAGRVDDGIELLRATAVRARSDDDWTMLAFALTGLHIYVDRVDVPVDEILAAIARADHHWSPSFRLSPAVLRVQSEGFRIGELVAAGEVARARRAVTAFTTRYGEELGIIEANVLLFGITDALLAGDFLEWQRRLARFREDPELVEGFGAHLAMCELMAAWLQGRLGEFAPLIEAAPATLIFIRPGLALAFAEGSRDDDAHRVLLECAAGDGLERRARTVFGRVELTMLGYATALVGDSAIAERLYDVLRPSSGRVSAWAAWAFWGAFDAVLGVLAMTAGRHDDAVEHLDAALALHDRAGWHALAVRTATDLAHALLDRGDADDRDRAAAIVAATGPTVLELGLERTQQRLASAASRLASAE